MERYLSKEPNFQNVKFFSVKFYSFIFKPNTWNFDACNGCEDCDCAPASESQQCDLTTGQCKCSPTVFGKKCDWCKLGYFNYSSAGCQSMCLLC